MSALPRKTLIAGLAALVLLISPASARDECESGGYDAVQSADGTSLTLLFDNVIATPAVPSAKCSFIVPLGLPDGKSIGVYKIDYRGFAVLKRKEDAQLEVDYAFGDRDQGRRFKRQVKGSHDGEFAVAGKIGAGLMKRIGCGADATLRGFINLSLAKGAGADALAALDSSDGAARGALVYHFDLKPCRQSSLTGSTGVFSL